MGPIGALIDLGVIVVKKRKLDFGITEEENCKIEAFVKTLGAFQQNTHIRKSKDMPRSMVVIPGKGYYILCKSKGVHWEKRGGTGRATLAFDETRKKLVFRSSLAGHVRPEEIDAHRIYSKVNNSYFVTGDVVNYVGSWKSRGKGKAYDFQMINKVGIIMDYIPGDELEKAIMEKLEGKSRRSNKEWIFIMLHLVKAHLQGKEVGLVDYDRNMNNILLGQNDVPKIIDFGGVFKVGTKIDKSRGTLGLMPPEILEFAYNGKECKATPQSEIWGLGVMLSLIFRGPKFYDWLSFNENDQPYGRCFTKNILMTKLRECFPNYNNIKHIDRLIVCCLAYEPEMRISGEDLRDALNRWHEFLEELELPQSKASNCIV